MTLSEIPKAAKINQKQRTLLKTGAGENRISYKYGFKTIYLKYTMTYQNYQKKPM